jgi:hypothetical protein
VRTNEYLRETPLSQITSKKRKKEKKEEKSDDTRLLYYSENHEQVIFDQLNHISTSLKYTQTDTSRKTSMKARTAAMNTCYKYFNTMLTEF